MARSSGVIRHARCRAPGTPAALSLVLGLIVTACGVAGLPQAGDREHDDASTQATGIGSQDNARPAWSPDGRTIAFETKRTGNREIFVMDADGSNPRNCTKHGGADQYPVWSPDGAKILFQSRRSGNDELYAIDFDPGTGQCAGQPANLTNAPSHERPGDWGPGGLIAFSTGRDGNLEVYLMNEDGSRQRDCSSHRASDHTAAFSPDGSEVAFHSHRNLHPKTNNGEIWVAPIRADGTCDAPARVTTNDYLDESPDYDPANGNVLVVHRNMLKAGAAGADDYDLFLINRATGAETRVTSGPANDVHPSFSPDGSRIAFNSNRDGRYDIWVIDADGSNPRNLTPKSSSGRRPHTGS